MYPLFINLALSVTGSIILMVLLLLVAGVIGYLTAWYYAKSIYTPIIAGLEKEKAELNSQILGLKDDVSKLNGKIDKLNDEIVKLNSEIDKLNDENVKLNSEAVKTKEKIGNLEE
jgi:peptidoglycan hydrolase CwlO-like protein